MNNTEGVIVSSMSVRENIDKAVSIVGTQTALASRLGVVQGAIQNWILRNRVPAEHCPAIERETGGAVRCEDLRPDIPWEVLRLQCGEGDKK